MLKDKTDIEIVSGKCEGADAMGEQYAEERGYPIKSFPADWGKHGKSAGPMRNRVMAAYANAAIVFWDGKSRGSANMIQEAKDCGLLLRIIKYEYATSK